MGGHDDNVQALVQRLPHARVVRYYDNHLNTLKRCISRCRTPFAWVISSCCDYTNFDFDYRAKPWEAYQIHCWASNGQKFGDTFLIPVAEFNLQADIELLEWYKDINWHEDGVPRLLWPFEYYDGTNLVETVRTTEFKSLYCWFKPTEFHTESLSTFSDDVCLWTEKQRNLMTFSARNSLALVPKDVKKHLKTQLYDYPSITKRGTVGERDLDIIYISNGEPDAERWYEHLTKNGRKVKRVQNVNGRAAAYKAAAELSETPWFFAVFAKLEVDRWFKWSWQPDLLQEPKHYIFHSKNPVNGLEYGHMGVIAYNKQLVLETDNPGLDFTLSKPHAVVPIVSGVAHYNTTPELTWRTAFREVLKLQDDVVKTESIESRYRLGVWLGIGDEWSIKGAEDAVEYYTTVDGDYTELMRSFEWAWLKEYYAKKYLQ